MKPALWLAAGYVTLSRAHHQLPNRKANPLPRFQAGRRMNHVEDSQDTL